MPAFAVTGTATPLGALVVTALGGKGAVTAIGPTGGEPPADAGQAAAPSLDGVGCLVSLAIGPCPSPALGGAESRLAQLRSVLAAGDRAGLRRVVHLSSAVVYGAAPDNAVPLTEDAAVRPDARFPWAVELAEAERLVLDWRDGGADRAAAVLRPALVVAPGDNGSLARALGGLSGPKAAGDHRPVQFVHVDDVAAAVVTCATAADPVDGALNVAPEGWVSDEEAAALAGALLPPPSVPAGLVPAARRLFWALGVSGATPPGAEAYATHPWVVAADRLRDLGWTPSHSTEEAVVATTTGSTLATLSPRRRQELLLATTAAVIGGAVLAVAALLVRVARGSRR